MLTQLLPAGAWRWLPQSEAQLRSQAALYNNEEHLPSSADPPALRTNSEILASAAQGDAALLAGINPEKPEYGHPR